MGTHEGHVIRDIAAVASEARARLSELLQNKESIHDDEIYIAIVKAKIHDVMNVQTNMKSFVASVRSLLKDIETKVTALENDTDAKLTAEIKNMTLMESDATDLLTSKRSLIDYGIHLVETASDPEVVVREAEFPRWATSGIKRKPQFAEMPSNMYDLVGLTAKLDSVAKGLRVNYKLIEIGQLGPHLPEDACQMETKPFKFLEVVHKVSEKSLVRSIALDTKRLRVIVRTNEDSGPIKLYDYQGKYQSCLGRDLGLIERDNRGIAMDTKRDLYVVPIRKALLRITLDGTLESEKHVPKYVAGVAYSRSHDVYVFTASNKVYMTDADTKEAVTSFKPRVSFNHPWNVTCGVISGFNDNKPVIAVSESGACAVKLLDFTGNLLHTFGGSGKLNQPWGVSPGPGGRLLVCDQYNYRVEGFWSQGDNKETIVGKKQGVVKRPMYVTCDPIERLLVVGLCNNDVIIYKGV